MGLLGKDWSDPKTMATFQMAAGLLGGGNFGQAAARGLSAYSDTMSEANKAAMLKEERDYIKQQREMAAAQEKRQRDWRSGLPAVMAQKVYGAGDEGPTMERDAGALNNYLMSPDSPFAEKMLEQKLFPQAADYRVVGGDLVKIGQGGVSVAHQSARPDNRPSEQKLFDLAVSQGYKGDLMSFMRDIVSNKEGARAAFDVMPVTRPDGTTSLMPRSAVAAQAGGGAVRPSGRFQGGGYNGGSAGAAANDQRAILSRELESATRDGRTQDAEALQRELGRLPGGFQVQSKAQEAAAVAAATDAATGKTQERESTKAAKLSSIDAQIGAINKAIDHPGRKTATGLSGQLDPRNYMAGTNAKDFQVVLDQLGGSAFLQAFESLKGGGQITEVEGTKATAAIARLNRAQSDGEFLVALQDLREVMEAGRKRLAGGEKSDTQKDVAAQPLPPNPSAANLQRNTVYDTPRGPAMWDGMKFTKVK
jgi:hypothetical protein